jgi:hypothetical protein
VRRAAKIDANQREITEALRQAGATVYYIKEPCDLLVGRRGINYLLEIKDGSRRPSQRRLTVNERFFHASWNGQIAVVESVADALKVISC